MEGFRDERGFGERLAQSARSLGSDVFGTGAQLENDLSNLTLRCGKAHGVRQSSSSSELPQQSRGTRERRREGRLRSEMPGSPLEDDFETFMTTSSPIEEPGRAVYDPLDDFDFDYFLKDFDYSSMFRKGSDATTSKPKDEPGRAAYDPLNDVDFEASLSWPTPADYDMAKDFDFDALVSKKGLDTTGSAWQTKPTSEIQTGYARGAHALPAELRSIAQDRLKQIKGHFTTGKASAAARAAAAQRRADLKNEWLLWWDESPTACFDDSKDYLAHDPQRVYSEAWEKHMQHKVEARPHWKINNTPLLQPAPSRAVQRTAGETQDAGSSLCPSKGIHQDATARGRSAPVAAQHRACPHAGCGYCSTTSTAWFEHVRSCAA